MSLNGLHGPHSIVVSHPKNQAIALTCILRSKKQSDQAVRYHLMRLCVTNWCLPRGGSWIIGPEAKNRLTPSCLQSSKHTN